MSTGKKNHRLQIHLQSAGMKAVTIAKRQQETETQWQITLGKKYHVKPTVIFFQISFEFLQGKKKYKFTNN